MADPLADMLVLDGTLALVQMIRDTHATLNSIPFLTQTTIPSILEQLHPKKHAPSPQNTLCDMYKSVDCKTIDSNGHNHSGHSIVYAGAAAAAVARFTCTSATVDADNDDNVQGLLHAKNGMYCTHGSRCLQHEFPSHCLTPHHRDWNDRALLDDDTGAKGRPQT